MNVLLQIQVNDQGQIGLVNKVPDMLQALGLLEVAKEILKDEASKVAKGTPQILVARGALPAVSGNGNG